MKFLQALRPELDGPQRITITVDVRPLGSTTQAVRAAEDEERELWVSVLKTAGER